MGNLEGLAILDATIERELRVELAKLDALGTAPPAEDGLKQCDASIAFAERAEGSPSAALVGARARYEKARVLSLLGRKEESRAAVRELFARYEHATAPDVRRILGRALFGQTKDRLEEGADRRSAIAEYRLVLHIAERQPPIEDMAASALYHLALTHAKIAIERDSREHREKALDRFREIEQRFAAHDVVDVARWTARAVLARAKMEPLDVAGATYEALFQRRRGDASLELVTHAAEALTAWAERCAEEDETARAAELVKRVSEAFGASEHPPIQERVHRSEDLAKTLPRT